MLFIIFLMLTGTLYHMVGAVFLKHSLPYVTPRLSCTVSNASLSDLWDLGWKINKFPCVMTDRPGFCRILYYQHVFHQCFAFIRHNVLSDGTSITNMIETCTEYCIYLSLHGQRCIKKISKFFTKGATWRDFSPTWILILSLIYQLIYSVLSFPGSM